MGTENFLVTCHADCHESRLTCFVSAKNTCSRQPGDAGSVTSASVSGLSGCLCELSSVSAALSSQHWIISHSSESSQKANEVFSVANERRITLHCSGLTGARARHCVLCCLVWMGSAPTDIGGSLHSPLMTCSKCTMCQEPEWALSYLSKFAN